MHVGKDSQHFYQSLTNLYKGGHIDSTPIRHAIKVNPCFDDHGELLIKHRGINTTANHKVGWVLILYAILAKVGKWSFQHRGPY